jgi:DNA/RNA-binding domain of Phe-tRNA-synthetase-like protein
VFAEGITHTVPVAVFDVSKITGGIEVRYAAGDEDYLTFSGQVGHPAQHEVIFAGQARQVHARRWTSRQSGLPAVRASAATALIAAEAMHGPAASDVPDLIAAITCSPAQVWLRPQLPIRPAADECVAEIGYDKSSRAEYGRPGQ